MRTKLIAIRGAIQFNMADTDEDLAEEDEVMSEGVWMSFPRWSWKWEVLFRLPGDTVAALDGVNLVEEFDLMKSDPRFLCGPYRSSMRVALEEINVDDAVRQERGWKLFLLLRLLLHRAPRSGTIPSQSCWVRYDQFNAGEWLDLQIAR